MSEPVAQMGQAISDPSQANQNSHSTLTEESTPGAAANAQAKAKEQAQAKVAEKQEQEKRAAMAAENANGTRVTASLSSEDATKDKKVAAETAKAPPVTATPSKSFDPKVVQQKQREAEKAMRKARAKPVPQYTGWKEVGGWDERDHLSSKEEAEDLLESTTLLETYVSDKYYGDWYHNTALIVVSTFFAWLVARLGGGIAWLGIVLAFTATAYRTSIRRLRRNARDDLAREMGIRKLETDTESMEWLNAFLVKFWLIYEPVLAGTIIATTNQVLAGSTPGFIESLTLDTFTLGTKPPRIDHVRTFPKTDEDVAVMDWKFSFTPNDTQDMTARQLKSKVNPKVVLGVRIGKGIVSKSLPILVEDMSFSGLMRVRIKMMTSFPHVQTVDISFLQPPEFDFVLKPIGGDTFGFDINVIPGLSGFITEMVHANLGPMFYAPNAFQLNIEQMLAGSGIDSAIGVLAVTLRYAKDLKGSDAIGNTVDPYVKFSFNERDELARSDIKQDTRNPTWNETKYLLVSNLNEVLTMSVVDFNGFRKDKHIGNVNFALETLRDKPDQEGISAPVLAAGKARGAVMFDVHWFPCLEGRTLEDGTVEPPPESATGIVKFTVHQCKDLDTTRSLVGQLSPYAGMYLNDHQVHSTKTLKRSNNPVWDESYEMLVTNKMRARLSVQVKDARGMSVDPTVGSYKIGLPQLLAAVEKGEDWFNMTPSGRIRLSATWKPVAIQGIKGGSAYIEPVGVLRFHIRTAKNLPNLETVGKIDPYVRLMCNGFARGRTDEIPDNKEPVWEQVVYVTVQDASAKIVVEAMDAERNGKDRSLGTYELDPATVIKTNEKGEYLASEIIERKDTLYLARKNSKATLHYSVQFLPAINVTDPEELEEKRKAAAKKEEEKQQAEAEGKKIEPTEEEKEGEQEQTKTVDMPLEEQTKFDSGVIALSVLSVSGAEQDSFLSVAFDGSATPSWQSGKLKGAQQKFGESAEWLVRELEWSQVRLFVSGRRDVRRDADVLAQVTLPTLQVLREAYDQPKTLVLAGRGSIKVVVRARYFPVPMKLDPMESISNQGLLKVDVLDAHELPAADRSGKSDPYARFLYNGLRVFKTQVQKKTLEPVWNEVFELEVSNRQKDELKMEIYDWDMGPGSDDFLGGAVVRMQDLEPLQSEVQIVQLDKGKGSARLRLHFKPQYVTRKAEGNDFGATFTGTVGPAGKMLTDMGGAPVKVVGDVGGAAIKLGGGALGGVAAVGGAVGGGAVGAVGKGGSLLKSSLGFGKKDKSNGGGPPNSDNNTLSEQPSYDDTQDTIDSRSSLSPRKTNASASANGSARPGQVTLMAAKGFKGISHLQVRIYVVTRREKEIFKSKAVKSDGGEVRFDESVTFKAPRQSTSIVFRVRDHRSLGRDEELGEGQVILTDLVDGPRELTIGTTGSLVVYVSHQEEDE